MVKFNQVTTINDRKTPVDTTANDIADFFNPTVLQWYEYYPFGMIMFSENYGDIDYRFGFNNMEKDDEIKGSGNSYDFGARMYDPRIGNFLSIDPKHMSFPYQSPYLFAGNNPIRYIDVNGEFKLDPNIKAQYPAFAAFIENNIIELTNSDRIMKAYASYTNLTPDQIRADFMGGEGPLIVTGTRDAENIRVFGQYDGFISEIGEYRIFIDEGIIQRFEESFRNDNLTDDVKQAFLSGITKTLLHEYVHHGGRNEDAARAMERDVYGIIYPDNDRPVTLIQAQRFRMTGDIINQENLREVLDKQPDQKDPSVLPTLPNIE